MRETKVMVYNYDELPAGIREDIIQDELNFLVDSGCAIVNGRLCDEEFERAQAKADEMQTPWFFSYYLYDELKNDILAQLKSREYYSNGSIYLS